MLLVESVVLHYISLVGSYMSIELYIEVLNKCVCNRSLVRT
jgi:hypothetical protein